MSHDAEVWSHAQVVKAGPKSVLNTLAWRADRNTWRARPGVAQLADDTGLDERSVRRNLDWLEENGFIARRRRHAEGGRRKGERLVDEFELNPSRIEPDNLPGSTPDNSPTSVDETTGHFGGDNRAFCQGQPDILSSPYKDRTKIGTKNRTKIIGEPDLLGDSASKKSSKKKETGRLTAMPSSWPNTADLAWARGHWYDAGRDDLIDRIDAEAARARDHHTAKGTRFVDWSAAWKTWARNAVEFSKHSRSRPARRDSASAAAEELIRGDFS